MLVIYLPIRPIHALSCPVATTPSYTLHLTHSMSSLPSFVELMSSLGLEDGASLSRTAPTFLRPRSHSNASSSSDIDDDEREVPRQQYAPTGAYLFIPADDDRHDYTSVIDIDSDTPRVSRHCKGRYSPYSIDSVRTLPSHRPQCLAHLPCRSHGKEASRPYSSQEKRREYVSSQTTSMVIKY